NKKNVGLSLVEPCMFDVKDNILLAQDMKDLEKGNYNRGRGPSVVESSQRRDNREIEAANRFGQDILDFGVTRREPGIKRTPTTENVGCNPPTKKTRLDDMLKRRIATTHSLKDTMKLRSYDENSPLNWVFSVCSSVNGTAAYKTQICNVPSC
uniref:Uncharacterized protein n=1 Tax=Clytia hemisphaerica TaxID=252671 RepID=A0A7M5WV41_9CNID